ncbi:uncharacterized protein Z519_11260 [Cladophialophora bantiana CBS 173.52]|uniref:Zn(2)-C6 fungal-type domain-containing protein n=1 Tax=Cladophialophora bantiana (strain ATCC 10958 / CBS 173.52 / CDC B-1940 / NIH 8579) TaxID=1442370 RepID=A0A0D2HUC9_CLAB1|nr:uncharacterized protein Z519_11260 [Cladophialophora bantiana CBS 173.52]KIW88149.1 hypothetical protein Z519_11260 [Cladophialophora bantiana CBS 173.52]
MSSAPPTPNGCTPLMSQATAWTSSQASQPQRVLACVLCQQRKVKCDRVFPCANCVRSRAQCVPGSLAKRQRRRRLPERELLERLRKYEDLLRQNNVAFEPLHGDSTRGKGPFIAHSGFGSDDERPETVGPDISTPATTIQPGRGYGAKNVWHAMSQGYRDSDDGSNSSRDDELETAVNTAWDQCVVNDDNLLFGSPRTKLDVSTLHPNPVQIFKLWHIYLENVDPLLKIVHTPSLQGRIIEAAGDVSKIPPTLEALLFSIYSMSILSLTAEDCQKMFDSPKEGLLIRYQQCCQQALLNCSFLRSSDRECLTALYLYLISVRPSTVPQSLSSLLGVAVRIAQRMGIHSESVLASCTVVEAEMRRRLWWSLVLFDTRISETANSKTTTLDPTWDCRIPLNVNDSDLRPEMKKLPATQANTTTEALFAVVRCELGEVIRHARFHLDFTTPALKPSGNGPHGGPDGESIELVKLEEMIEDRYLKHCDQEHPLHFMTTWTTRAHLAKYRLLEHLSRSSNPSIRQTDAQRDIATAYALRMLECDTKTMTSMLTKGFRWLNNWHFPFPAYIQVAQDLRSRPMSSHARQAWDIISDNYEAWFGSSALEGGPFFRLFTKIILEAWEACEAAWKHTQEGTLLTTPRIVSSIKQALSHAVQPAQDTGADVSSTVEGKELDGCQMPVPTPIQIPMPFPMSSTPLRFAAQSLPHSSGMLGDYALPSPGIYAGMLGPDAHGDQWDWTGLGGQPGWEGF